MGLLTAIAVVALQGAAATGFGALVLAVLRVDAARNGREYLVWSFCIGTGLLGWLLFFVGWAGLFTPTALLILLVIGCIGLVWLRRPFQSNASEGTAHLDGVAWLLLAGIAFVLLVDFVEATAPPADADTLAYHFALPKQFIAAGRLEFVPRAVDGAIPLLLQMTYVPVLALGGEKALTLWTMLTGWTAGLLLFFLCRRHLSLNWSLATTLLYLTTPVVLLAGGTGHVEIRMVLFVTLGVYLTALALRRHDWRLLLAGGLLMGFTVGAKFTGLVIATAWATMLLLHRGTLRHLALVAAVAMIGGGQWYLWNWLHTGDPIFPMFYGVLDYADATIWDESHAAALRQMIGNERAVPANPFWLVTYPFLATFNWLDGLDTARAGFGVAGLLLFPLAAAGAWRFRDRLNTNVLRDVAITVAAFYILWFLLGQSQRVRHFLPLYPLLLLCMAAAAERWLDRPKRRAVASLAVALVLIVQLGGQGLVATNFLKRITENESRDEFLARNVVGYAPVPWINANLGKDDRIFVPQRNLIYLIDVPVFYGHWADEARIDISPGASDPATFLRQLRRNGITHLLVNAGPTGNPPPTSASGTELWRPLVEKGCSDTLATFRARSFASRTLSSLAAGSFELQVINLKPSPCDLVSAAKG